jgi:hypothetical protein
VARFGDLSDTDPKVMELFIRLHREKPAGEKTALVFEMTDMMLAFAKAMIRREHPGASEQEIVARLAARRLEPTTVAHAYGWDVEHEQWRRPGI